MGTLLQFAFGNGGDPKTLEADLGLAIFAAECIYGRPRVRMEAAYSVAEDGSACVLDIGGESGEAAARVFTGLAATRMGEAGFTVRRLTKSSDSIGASLARKQVSDGRR